MVLWELKPFFPRQRRNFWQEEGLVKSLERAIVEGDGDLLGLEGVGFWGPNICEKVRGFARCLNDGDQQFYVMFQGMIWG